MYLHDERIRRAAQPTVDAIARRESRVSRTVKAVLAEIRRHYCDPGYTLKKLRHTLKISRQAMTVFRGEVGLTPGRFIRHCRMQTAARLLRDTALSVADVGFFVAYYDVSAFERAFRRWCRLRPAGYRVLARELKVRFPGSAEEIFTKSCWRKCRTGEGKVEQVRELAEYLKILRSLWTFRRGARGGQAISSPSAVTRRATMSSDS